MARKQCCFPLSNFVRLRQGWVETAANIATVLQSWKCCTGESFPVSRESLSAERRFATVNSPFERIELGQHFPETHGDRGFILAARCECNRNR